VVVLKSLYPDTQVPHSEGANSLETIQGQIIGMALQVYIALHIEGLKDVSQNLVEPAIEHGGGGSATDVKGSYRLIANQLRIDVNLFLNSVGIPFRYLRVINLFVVRAVRADLAAEGDMEIKAEFVKMS